VLNVLETAIRTVGALVRPSPSRQLTLIAGPNVIARILEHVEA